MINATLTQIAEEKLAENAEPVQRTEKTHNLSFQNLFTKQTNVPNALKFIANALGKRLFMTARFLHQPTPDKAENVYPYLEGC